MRKGIFGSIFILSASAGLAFAQPGFMEMPEDPAPASCAAPHHPPWSVPVDQDVSRASYPEVWIYGEYLYWKYKKQPLATPLITTGPAAAGLLTAGALGVPGTVVLSPGSVDYGDTSGVRAHAGRWIDDCGTYGIEASGFLMDHTSTGFGANDPTGATVIAQPFSNSAGALATPVSFPGTQTGGIAVTTSNRLWGAEFDFLCNVCRHKGLTANLLAGFRYADLNETLESSAATSLAPQGLPGTTATFNDYWAGRNQFYGGQLGTKIEYQYCRVFINGTAKVAAGNTHQAVTINGNNATFVGGVPAGFAPGFIRPGGNLSDARNIGRFTQERFAYIPEATVNVGYCFNPCISIFAGYNFLYWNSVVRPGNQIDNNFNTANLAAPPPFVPMAPSGFWAHGINVGLEFNF